MERGLHQAVALACMTLLFTAHRAIMNSGFTLKRRGVSTDTLVVSIIGLLTCAWTGMVVLSGLQLDDRPCRQGFAQCAARLSYSPFIMLILFFFWIISYVDQVLLIRSKWAPPLSAQGSRSSSNHSEDHIDLESRKTLHSHFEWLHEGTFWLWIKVPPVHLGIWRMSSAQGPLNWRGSIFWPYRLGLYATMFCVVGVISFGAVSQKLYTIALLNVVGVILFAVDAAGSNTYMDAPHIYTRDSLRIMLHTRHLEGHCYVLPCRYRGFDAVWGPKIKSENKALDEVMQKWLDDGGYHSGKLPRMDKVMADFHSRTIMSDDDIFDLASWLYLPEDDNYRTMRVPVCANKKDTEKNDVHLIASSIMLALWQAEYLVMMRKRALETRRSDLDILMGTLRSARGSGLNMKPQKQIGSGDDGKAGISGYREAVAHVYKLFGRSVPAEDDEVMAPTSKPPTTSVVSGLIYPDGIIEYTGALWTYCFQSQESTFAALFAFTMYWQADIGMDISRGRHGFPFEDVGRDGDIVTWHVIWRQAWYQAIIAQLTSMSPIIFSAFIAGILQ
ncbi:hypothetical protein Forpe1208_v014463 [Fusarium oxysporum f. sp. rapae]|uniref:Uncharacterized protein n=1 Tax=Fusarium oxysporum f. sp. rapae TaxID=485398 RepID=A0A8J5TNR1_FUSOX|nr:hypothetical protein Forpe1208_v014463 [Fusarium oxysporum f. sp. rapae]